MILVRQLIYFVKHETKDKKFYTVNEVISMLEFLIDQVFVEFEGHIFSTNHRHPHGNKLCPSPYWSFPILLWARVYAKTYRKQKIFNFALWYIGDVRSINNPNFTTWTPLTYHQRTWDKENNRNIVLCFISWHLPLIWQQGSTTRLKFNFAIITFPHLDSFPIYISQLIRCTLYAWACNLYSDF